MQLSARPGRAVDMRRDLMDVAIDCFARYGYQATSIARIAKAAGVTKGALYYHFTDKEALLVEAVLNRIGQFEHRVSADIAPMTDPIAALRRLACICVDHATKSNHRRLIVTVMVEALDTNPRLAAQFQAMMHRFRQFVSGIIEFGQEQRTFRGDVDPATAAAVWAGAIMGAEIQYYQDSAAFELGSTLDAFVEQYIAWLTGPAPTGRAHSGRARRRNTIRRRPWSVSNPVKSNS